ncbi:hypothetical protein [Crossiella cryophila]|uniref:Uncharacterized protein n=1 Tax=Crossiella cryophila TaxID=43355 RepID=A0A7W7C3Y5_9PSEU|nr:hypothetical protein [Crossiella cryophila]MBB4674098.1 hypothetical protein [Crossiella cryophila]
MENSEDEVMGSDWDWEMHHAVPWTPARIERMLGLFADGGWRLAPRLHPLCPEDGPEDGLREVGRAELVIGLAEARWGISLWDAEEDSVFLHTSPTSVRVNLSGGNWREPRPEADGYRLRHRGLTELWVELGERFDGLFGRVEDEWSLEQVWSLLPDPLGDDVPPPGQWPHRLGWWTYFNAERADLLPNPPAGLRLTPSGAVLALLDDPAAVDALEFERIHLGMLAR